MKSVNSEPKVRAYKKVVNKFHQSNGEKPFQIITEWLDFIMSLHFMFIETHKYSTILTQHILQNCNKIIKPVKHQFISLQCHKITQVNWLPIIVMKMVSHAFITTHYVDLILITQLMHWEIKCVKNVHQTLIVKNV